MTALVKLLDDGAEINAVDIRGDTALHAALNNRQRDLALHPVGARGEPDCPRSVAMTRLHWAGFCVPE